MIMARFGSSSKGANLGDGGISEISSIVEIRSYGEVP